VENQIKIAVQERFKKLLELLDISQKNMAEVLEVHKASISQIVNGRDNVKADLLHKLFNAYGVDPLWLTNGVGDPILTNRIREQELLEHEETLISSPNIEQKVKDSRKDISDKLHMLNSEEVARLQEQVAMLNKLLDAKEEHLEDLRAVVRHYQQTDPDSDSSEEDTSGDIALAS